MSVLPVAACPCNRSGSDGWYVVGGGVFDDLVVGQTHDASRLVPLRGAALDFHSREGGVLAVVFGVARLGEHLVGVLGWLGHVGHLDCMGGGVLLSRR